MRRTPATPTKPAHKGGAYRIQGWAAAVLFLASSGAAWGSDSKITFNRDIAPLVYDKCAPCHRPGGSAPFSLLSYEDVRRRARQIVEVTQSKFMPPWQPAPGYGAFKGERRLSPQQLSLLSDWFESGMPRGDSPAPPAPEWPEGWELGQPDLVLTLDRSYTLPASGPDVFRNFVLPIPVNQPRFVRAVELHPGSPQVVHHAVMQLSRRGACGQLDARDPEPGFAGMDMGDSWTPPGQILSWTPGRRPGQAPEGMAWLLEPGTDLILQVHMVPTGKPEPVQPQIGLYFAERPPEVEAVVFVLRENQIDIPAGEKAYVVEDTLVLPAAVKLISLYPHAHYLAKDIQVEAEQPDGTREKLLWIPDWDFNWQDQYWYRDPPILPAGTQITMRYTYDNSADNPRNPNVPPKRVVEGPQSSDEMGNLAVSMVPVDPADLPRLKAAQLQDLAQDPGNPGAWRAHLHLGRLAEEGGRVQDALQHYRKALRLQPDDYQAHFFLGAALHRQGKLEKAISHYRDAARLNPLNVEVLNNLGAALGQIGRLAEAVEVFERAVQLSPRNPQLRLNLGHALGENLGQAIDQYAAALRLDPNLAEAHNSLGIALAATGELDQALAHFEAALRIRPDYEDARRNAESVRRQLKPR